MTIHLIEIQHELAQFNQIQSARQAEAARAQKQAAADETFDNILSRLDKLRTLAKQKRRFRTSPKRLQTSFSF